MNRLWGKIIKNNRIIDSCTVEIGITTKSEIESIQEGLQEICTTFDLQNPTWYESNKSDFVTYGKTTFNADHFIESIEFNAFEIEFLEEE